MQFALALIASFLPSRQRRRWGLESTTLLQRAAFCGAILQTSILGMLSWRTVGGAQLISESADPLSRALLVIHAIAGNPVGLLYALFAIEGILRALVLLGMGEVFPSLAVAIPLNVLARMFNHHSTPRFTLYRRRDDKVEQLGDKLVVATSHLKPEWRDAAVCFAGLYYKAGGPHPGQHGLPYVYVLRPWPIGIVIRKTQYYNGPGFAFGNAHNRAS